MKRYSKHVVIMATFTAALAMTGQAIAQEAAAEEAPATEAEAPEAAPFEAVAEEPPEEETAVESEQEPLPLNSIYAEGLGAGFLYSFNYERVLPMDFAVRVGFGYLGIGATETDPDTGTELSVSVGFFTIPITFSWLGLRTDSGTHMLELGVGTTVIGLTASGTVDIPLAGALFGEGAVATAVPHLVIGYRLQADSFQLRAGFTPLVSIGDEVSLIPLPHLSMGAAF